MTPQPAPPSKGSKALSAIFAVGVPLLLLMACGGLALFFSLNAYRDGAGQPSKAVTSSVSSNGKAGVMTPTPDTRRATGDELARYSQLIRSVDPNGSVIVGASQGRGEGEVKVTVANQWHYEPYRMRLQTAQKLWEVWASIHSPNEPDKARITIRDLNGNEVGGSRVWGGSLIWVEE